MDQLEEKGGVAMGGNSMPLFLAWLWVSIPLLWGLTDTFNNALKLFK